MMQTLTRVYGHTFFPGLLSPGGVVMDLGANVGEFCHVMANSFQANCVAVEPNPACYAAIQDGERLTKINAAISSQEGGAVPFYLAQNSESSSLIRGDESLKEILVPAMTFKSLIGMTGTQRVDLLKVDIEGAEKEFFASASDRDLQRISQIVVEFHDFCGLITHAEVDEIILRMKSLGFSHIEFSRGRSGREDSLFVNRLSCHLSNVDFFVAAYVGKYLLGSRRILSRIFGGKKSVRSGRHAG